MSHLIKKSLVLLLLSIVGLSSVFATTTTITANNKEKKKVFFSLAGGIDLKYKYKLPSDCEFEDGEKLFEDKIFPSMSLICEIDNDDVTIPMKFTANVQPSKAEKFWNGEDKSFSLSAIAEIRLLKLDAFKLFLGGGVNYDTSLRTEDNKFSDATSVLLSSSISVSLSKTVDLISYTYLPFDTLIGAIDNARGAEEGREETALAPGSLGIQFSIKL